MLLLLQHMNLQDTLVLALRGAEIVADSVLKGLFGGTKPLKDCARSPSTVHPPEEQMFAHRRDE